MTPIDPIAPEDAPLESLEDRLRAAADPATPKAVLESLMQDEDPRVRSAVASNEGARNLTWPPREVRVPGAPARTERAVPQAGSSAADRSASVV